MRPINYLFAALLLAARPAAAQEAVPLSLKDAMDYAVKHNNAAKNARLDIELQQAKNAEITGTALPQVNAKNDFTYYAKPILTPLPGSFNRIFDPNADTSGFTFVQFTPKFANTLSATASQVLFDGTLLVALQAKKVLMHLAGLGAQATEENVRYNVQRAYYALCIGYKQFGILNVSLSTARKMAADQEVMRKAGFVEKIEMDRTTVQINNLAADSLRTANLILVSEQLLKYNMGMDISQPIVLTDTAVDAQAIGAQQMIDSDFGYERRTEFNQLQDQLRLNMYDLKRYRYAGLPTLSAYGTYAYTYSANTFNEVATPSNYFKYALIGVQLNVPIFRGFQRTNQVRQAKLTIEKTKNDIDNLKLTIDLQAAQSKTVLRNSLLTLSNAERTLELSGSIVDLANKKYKAGVGSSLEVNQAQTDLLQSQNNYFQSLLDVINAQSDLQKARGDFK